MRYLIFLLFTLGSLWGCQPRKHDLKSIYRWINDPDRGLIKTKTIEGIKLTVKYLPPAFLALKEAKEEGAFKNKVYDSLFKVYNQSHTFLLIISSVTRGDTNDPMYKDLEDYPHYRQRALIMNFDMHEYISLRASKNEFKPILASMENTYSLKGQRNVYVVFADQSQVKTLITEPELDFVFDDEIFQTGTSHFVFKQSDLRSIMAIDLKELN